MFVDFHDNIRNAKDVFFSDNAEHFDQLIIAHKQQSILLCITPANVKRLQDNITFGPISQNALAKISKRSPDYRAAMDISRRVYRVLDSESIPVPFKISSERFIDTKLDYFASKKSIFSPRLFVENSDNDFLCINSIYQAYCKVNGYPAELVKIIPAHGGGTGIGSVLRNMDPGEAMGLCLCDRDYHPFDPDLMFRHGTTAASTYKSAVELNMISEGETGYSTCDPFFSFDVTMPRTIEGFIGPRLLEIFFDNNPGNQESRDRILAAFPTAPDYSEIEMAVWFSANLKDSGVKVEELSSAISKLDGRSAFSRQRLELAAKSTIPSSAAKWIWSGIQYGRSQRLLLKAFERQMDSDLYSKAVTQIAEKIRDLHSADSRMRFA